LGRVGFLGGHGLGTFGRSSNLAPFETLGKGCASQGRRDFVGEAVEKSGSLSWGLRRCIARSSEGGHCSYATSVCIRNFPHRRKSLARGLSFVAGKHKLSDSARDLLLKVAEARRSLAVPRSIRQQRCFQSGDSLRQQLLCSALGSVDFRHASPPTIRAFERKLDVAQPSMDDLRCHHLLFHLLSIPRNTLPRC
jgi:hypothetical protein